jgi:hypothetical protein
VRNRSPVEVEALRAERVLSVHAGWEFSLALLEGGTVVGWGWNTHGQLGIAGLGAAGPRACFPTPTAMAGFGDAPLLSDDELTAADGLAGGPGGGGRHAKLEAEHGASDAMMRDADGALAAALPKSAAPRKPAGQGGGQAQERPEYRSGQPPPPPTLSVTPVGGWGGQGATCHACGRIGACVTCGAASSLRLLWVSW